MDRSWIYAHVQPSKLYSSTRVFLFLFAFLVLSASLHVYMFIRAPVARLACALVCFFHVRLIMHWWCYALIPSCELDHVFRHRHDAANAITFNYPQRRQAFVRCLSGGRADLQTHLLIHKHTYTYILHKYIHICVYLTCNTESATNSPFAEGRKWFTLAALSAELYFSASVCVCVCVCLPLCLLAKAY